MPKRNTKDRKRRHTNKHARQTRRGYALKRQVERLRKEFGINDTEEYPFINTDNLL